MSRLRTVLWVAALLLPSTLQAYCAQTQPSCGMIFSPSQPAALRYNCKSISESRITCSFTQLSVWKTRYPSLEETLAGARPARDEQSCAEASRALEDALKKPPADTAASRLEARNEQRRIDELKATVEYCRTGDKEAYREYFTREHDIQQKACSLSAHSYAQTFRREAAGPESPARWVTEEKPFGECRFHRVAQFTRDDHSWGYSAQYKVLNKSGHDEHADCAETREQEAIFVSSQYYEGQWVDCETVRFDEGCWSPDFPCLGGPPVVMY
jgi:hypothetical protein